MDEQRFDTIVQQMAVAAPRRAAMRGLGGAVALLAAIGLTGGVAADRQGGGDGKESNGRGGNGKKNKGDGKKRERQRDRQRKRSSANNSASGGQTGGTGATGATGPTGPDEDPVEDVSAEAKRGKPGPPGPTGPAGPAGPLDILTDVILTSPPSDGQVLAFVAGGASPGWKNVNEARLTNLFLTSQSLALYRNNATTFDDKLDLSLADLDSAVTRTQRFPDASGAFVLDTAAQLLTNKTVNDDSFVIQDDDAPSAKARFNATLIDLNATRIFTFPNASGTLVLADNAQTLQNKTLSNTNTVTLSDANFTLQDNGDATRQAKFDASGIDTGVTHTYALPNASGTLALASATGFTVTEVEGDVIEVDGGPTDLSATCPNGKAVGIGYTASGPVEVREMRFTGETEVRVNVASLVPTNVRAVARCMTMP